MKNLPINIKTNSSGLWNSKWDIEFGGFSDGNSYKIIITKNGWITKSRIFNKSSAPNTFNIKLFPEPVAPPKNNVGPVIVKPTVTVNIRGSVSGAMLLNTQAEISALNKTAKTYNDYLITKGFNTAISSDENELNELKANGIIVKCVPVRSGLTVIPSSEITIPIQQTGNTIDLNDVNFSVEIPDTSSKTIQISGTVSKQNSSGQSVVAPNQKVRILLFQSNNAIRGTWDIITDNNGNYEKTIDVTRDIYNGYSFKQIHISVVSLTEHFTPPSRVIPFSSIQFPQEGSFISSGNNFVNMPSVLSLSPSDVLESIWQGQNSTISVTNASGSGIIPFSAEVTKGGDWITITWVTQMNTNQYGSINVRISPNPNRYSRPGMITVSSPNADSIDLEVKQFSENSGYTSDPEFWNPSYEINKQTFTFNINENWEITCPEWITYSKNGNLLICETEKNLKLTSRSGYIYLYVFSDTNAALSIPVTQQAAPNNVLPNLTISPINFSSSSNGYYEFNVSNSNVGTGNINWVAKKVITGSGSGQSFFSLVDESNTVVDTVVGTGTSGKIKYKIEDDHRWEHNGRIEITATSSESTVFNSPAYFSITSMATSNLRLILQSAYASVSYFSGTSSFNISKEGIGTLNWTAVVDPLTVDLTNPWLTITSGSSGVDSGTIVCSFSTNTGEKRIGKIIVSAPGTTNQNGSETITIEQEKQNVIIGPDLGINPSSINTTKEETIQNFYITSMSPWTATITSGVDWLRFISSNGEPLTTINGSGNTNLKIKIFYNISGITRNGSIKVINTSTSNSVSASINQSGNTSTESTVITVNPEYSTYLNYSDNKNFVVKVTPSADWTVSVTEGSEWLSCSRNVFGSNNSFDAWTYQNDFPDERVGKITVYSGPVSKSVYIVQLGTSNNSSSLTIKPSNIANVDYYSGSVVFELNEVGNASMLHWFAEVSKDVIDNGNWISLSSSSGIAPGSITCSFSENTLAAPRSGIINILAPSSQGTQKFTITINQLGTSGLPIINLDINEITFQATDNTIKHINVTNGNPKSILKWNIVNTDGFVNTSPTGIQTGDGVINVSLLPGAVNTGNDIVSVFRVYDPDNSLVSSQNVTVTWIGMSGGRGTTIITNPPSTLNLNSSSGNIYVTSSEPQVLIDWSISTNTTGLGFSAQKTDGIPDSLRSILFPGLSSFAIGSGIISITTTSTTSGSLLGTVIITDTTTGNKTNISIRKS